MTVLALAGIVAAAMPFPAQAQSPQSPSTPFVPDEYLDRTRRLSGDTLHFCASSASALTSFDRAVAEEIATALLLDLEWTVLRYPFPFDPYEFQIGLAPEALFEALNNTCDVFTGYVLNPTTFPEWLTVSTPYLDTRYVLAYTGTDAASLGDLPSGSLIGTRLASGGDAMIVSFMASAREGRWRRAPHPHHSSLINALTAGTVDVAVVWEPALYLAAAQQAAPEHWTALSGGPSLPAVTFGMVTLRENVFIRELIDDAIAYLDGAGVLAELRDTYLFTPQSE